MAVLNIARLAEVSAQRRGMPASQTQTQRRRRRSGGKKYVIWRVGDLGGNLGEICYLLKGAGLISVTDT